MVCRSLLLFLESKGLIKQPSKKCTPPNPLANLSKNSLNSSKRPSSDDITKPKKGKSGEKGRIGGQPGHSRNAHALFSEEDIDKFHFYYISTSHIFYVQGFLVTLNQILTIRNLHLSFICIKNMISDDLFMALFHVLKSYACA